MAGGGGLMLALAATGARAADDAPALVRKYLGALNSHDAHGAKRYLAEDFTWYDPAAGNPVEGRDKVVETVLAPYLAAVPDLVWEKLGDPIVQGEMLAQQWRRSGTNSGPWFDGRPATGKHFVQLGASIFSVRDGKLATQSDYSDALGLYRQLGWI
jgi:steroid delta-isomerase-like uncharacterized protein